MSSLRLTNYKDQINIPKKNFKNKVKINLDEDHEGKILLEVSFIKDGSIFNKHLRIFKTNLMFILDKFKQNGFLIMQNKSESNISNLNNVVGNLSHPEYRNNNSVGFLRNSYNNSFNQKFK